MKQRFTLSVKKIISCHGGGCIFKGMTESGSKITIVAPYNVVAQFPVLMDDIWTVVGEFRHHHEYGEQLYAEDMEMELPKNDLIIDFLMKSPRFRNIGLGQMKIERLWKEFRDGLSDILEQGNMEMLVRDDLLTERTATLLVDCWKENAVEISVRKWLKGNKIDKRLARKIIRIWGDDAIKHLENDPYLLILFFSWNTVDALGKKLGIADDDDRRLLGAVESALYQRLGNGHTITSQASLIKLVQFRLKCDTSLARRALAVAADEKILVGNEIDGYQHIGVERLERRIRERLLNMLVGESGAQLSLVTFCDDDIEKGILSAEKKLGLKLSPLQHQAVRQGVKEPLSVICGGAGTGKTTILLAIHEVLSKYNIPIYQMALSGRAAQRMKESTRRDAWTIAKFCMEVKTGKHEVPSDALIIIDESSMVDLPSMFRLLMYIPVGARILMVGDPHQLPPISFGLVFHRLVESEKIPTVMLKQVHRQTEESGIPVVASNIRSFYVPKALTEHTHSTSSGVSFIESRMEHTADLIWDSFVEMGANIADVRVLTAVNGNAVGVNAINEMFQYRINSGGIFQAVDRWKYAIGEPVIYKQNDYDLGIFNGSLGRIADIFEADDGWRIKVLWDDNETREVVEANAVHLSLAYCMTVHKAQGSQFKRIICPIFKSQNLDNSSIYTALTRGIEQVVFIGDRTAFDNAIKSPSKAMLRNVGFNL